MAEVVAYGVHEGVHERRPTLSFVASCEARPAAALHVQLGVDVSGGDGQAHLQPRTTLDILVRRWHSITGWMVTPMLTQTPMLTHFGHPIRLSGGRRGSREVRAGYTRECPHGSGSSKSSAVLDDSPMNGELVFLSSSRACDEALRFMPRNDSGWSKLFWLQVVAGMNHQITKSPHSRSHGTNSNNTQC